jgi:thiol:disulfide interchange protein DsbC
MSAARTLALLAALWCGLAGAADTAPKSAIEFSALPLELAVTQVRGSGRRVFATFEDPNCGYCKEFARQLADTDDVTIHTFIYPILSADSRAKARAIWCAPDRAAAWRDWMTSGKSPPPRRCDAHAIDEILALGRKLKIRATPTIFLADGERLSGLPDAMEFQMAISSPKALSAPAK